ncbi:MAG TPA: endolytic transglycosylase MltG [Solirubrobacterales bacterium]|nr:endolytic transglycosylase MltG [Solirubrobacterales bacterium]
MSDDRGDPFVDPGDPQAVERAERRREREAKRAEKAARQKQKDAAAPPPPPPSAAPPAQPRTPEQEFWDEPAEPVPPDAAPAPDAAAPAAAAAAATSEAVSSEPAPPTNEAPRPDPPPPTTESSHPDPAPPPRPMEETGAGDWEPPPPRDDWFDEDDDHELHDSGDPRMAGAARTGRRHGDDDGRRGGFIGALLRHPFRIVAAIVAIVVVVFLWALFQPFHGDGHGRVAVSIPKGSSVGEVGDLLEKKGVISNSTLFQIRVTLAGKRSDLFAGKFIMAKDMSYGSAIDELSQEPEVVKPGVVTVTIPEGYTRSQAAQLVREDGLKGNYMKATVRSKYLDPAKYGGKQAKNLEGFLFPDTWELKSHSPVANLVQLQLQDFKKKIKHVNMKYAKSKNLTIYDVLTIASIIEHESGVPKQRKDVAAVIYNRLHEGMTLGSDATVRFATGNFTKPLTQSELESESPYNTRNHAGLPPGPISNPGLATIQAAAHPAKVPYLFFVTSPDCKTLAFAKTEAEFEEDVQKYEASKCTE